jgi:hypothetical protein
MWKLVDVEAIVKLFDCFLANGKSEGDKFKSRNEDA